MSAAMNRNARSLRALAIAALLAVSGSVFAAGSNFPLETPQIDVGNKKSLQRGARTFVNYCMGCHTADYHRYSRLAADLGLSEDDVVENLVFTTDKSGERSKVGVLMANTLSEDYGKKAFGVMPPNLALTARSRGNDWVYTYLKSFYVDPGTVVGVNNLVYPGAAMPHVLWEQQGWREAEFETTTDANGDEHKKFVGYKQITEGTMSEAQYDAMVTDLTAFLAYLADPIKKTRERIGMWVMLFLLVLTGLAYLLKKEYWKDVV